MRRLGKVGGIRPIVSQLRGYLQAVRDLNDDQSSDRYWYWADSISIKGQSVPSLIKSYLKVDDVQISEIDLKQELEIISRYVSANYMQGTSNPDNERESYVRYLHGWRIQEYISLAANYENEDGRWFTELSNDRETRTSVFVKIKRELVVMDFLKVNASAS